MKQGRGDGMTDKKKSEPTKKPYRPPRVVPYGRLENLTGRAPTQKGGTLPDGPGAPRSRL